MIMSTKRFRTWRLKTKGNKEDCVDVNKRGERKVCIVLTALKDVLPKDLWM